MTEAPLRAFTRMSAFPDVKPASKTKLSDYLGKEQMDRWSLQYDANFVCVCVLGDRSAPMLAKEFGNNLQLRNCVNGFVDNRSDMPSYGQLGCSGFIVLDPDHKVISRKTDSFLEIREAAFKSVEDILDSHVMEQQQKKHKMGADPNAGPLPDVSTMGVKALKAELQSRGVQIHTFLEKSEFVDALLQARAQDPAATAAATEDPAVNDEQIIFNMKSVPSVGVDSLDGEHDECISAIHKLAETRKLEHLEAAYSSISNHFQHEEELLTQHGFGANQPAEFSPLTSHVEDHKRILRFLEEEMERKKGACGTALACGMDFVQQLADEFHFHAEKFDNHYSELLIQAGAQ